MNFEAVYQELTLSTEIIRTLLAGITQQETQVKPKANSWSMLELLCHLYDEEREDFREHLDFILNRQQEEWYRISPERWVVERNYNGQDFNERRGRFFEERSKSLNWLEGLAESRWDIKYKSGFGELSAGDMLVSWVAHDNLAIRQFVELRRHRIEIITKPYAIEYAGDW